MITDKPELEKFLQGLIAKIAGKTCIWHNQNAPRPQKPYLCIQHISSNHVGMSEIHGPVADDAEISAVVKYGYQLDYYGANAVDELQKIERRFSFPSIVDACYAEGVSISETAYGEEDARLLDNLTYEERAFIEIAATITVTELDKTYSIETVDWKQIEDKENEQ